MQQNEVMVGHDLLLILLSMLNCDCITVFVILGIFTRIPINLSNCYTLKDPQSVKVCYTYRSVIRSVSFLCDLKLAVGLPGNTKINIISFDSLKSQSYICYTHSYNV